MIVQQPTAWFALKQYCLTSCFVFLLADTGLVQPNSVYTTTTEVGQYTLPVIMPSIWDVPPGYSPAALKEKSSEIDRIRTSELANEMLVSRMLDRTENEILASQQVIALYLPDLAKEIKSADRIESEVRKFVSAMRSIDCTQPEQVRPLIGRLAPSIGTANALLAALKSDELDNTRLGQLMPPLGTLTAMELCESLKLTAADDSLVQGAFDAIAKLKAMLLEKASENAAARDATLNYLSTLKKKREELQNRLNSTAAQQKISDSLVWIIGIVGFFSVLVIAAIRLFAERLQIEWVASGQVIQFVTVMILLSVITALALSNILKENTLGTLLGGIAGYVLAQGVGRAAAREVVRRIEAMPSVPPPETAGDGRRLG